jgi:spermidine synthase
VSSILHALGWTLLTLGAILLWHARRRGLAAVLLALVAVSGLAFGSGVGLIPRGSATVFQKDTLYHRLRVVDRDGLRTLYFNRMRQSAMALADPDRLELGYARAMTLGLAFQPEAERILFIGLGGGSLPRWVHRRLPRAEMDVAELDPEVVQVARRFFAVPEDPRLRLHELDGRVFVRKTTRDYDLVFLDAYFADALPFHLLTVEFFRELKTRLRPGGGVVLNLIGALDGPGSRLYRSVLRTLRTAYPEVYTIPVTRPDLVDRLGLRSDERRRNLILVAPREARKWTRAELLPAADRLIAAGRLPLEAKTFAAGLLEGEPSPDGVPILLDEHAPVDDLLHF